MPFPSWEELGGKVADPKRCRWRDIHRRSFYGERYEISSIEALLMCSNKRGEEDIAYDLNTDDNHGWHIKYAPPKACFVNNWLM